MARGKTILTAVVLLSHFSLMVNGTDIENLFPAHSHDIQPRLHVISLSGSSYNVTLNLSGIVILGLSLAAAVTLWPYLLALKELISSKTLPSSQSQNPSNQRTSVNQDRDALLATLNEIYQRFEDGGVHGWICHQRIICHIGASNLNPIKSTSANFRRDVNTYFWLNGKTKSFQKLLETDHRGQIYLVAWNEGKRGACCDTVYNQCSITREKINEFISDGDDSRIDTNFTKHLT